MVEASLAIASVTDANYCPEVYLIMLVVRHLLTITFAQISSCIGRLQVEKCVCKSICSSIKCTVFHRSTNLSSYLLDNDFSSSCIGKSQP